ncbi:MAG: polysaccharide pyruvyl transferase family protein [candidate division SR1 bacterium]|nr:polysaccharide pyruvyl transferase family protein [candidate division SR1 bacterium]
MDGYLRGYYGYKNFGDELLFFGIIKWIFANYTLEKLLVEVEDPQWMHHRVSKNAHLKTTDYHSYQDKIIFIQSKQHKHKWKTHIIDFLGMGKYKKIFKFFGGGEVLTDERKFPHDGRNIPLLFGRNVRKGQFVLLGGIATPHKPRTKFLYKRLFRKAQKIIVRDNISFKIVENYVSLSKTKSISKHGDSSLRSEGQQVENKIMLHQDFAVDTIHQAFEEGIGESIQHAKCILINVNGQENTPANREKILAFCKQYPLHQKIFFPCDMLDDAKQYKSLKHDIPDLIYYNWTEHNINQILNMFVICDGGIGCRLHFLLPLKLYRKTFEAIPYAEKIEKLILK